jgi:REP element-mobilizing transposase RayT
MIPAQHRHLRRLDRITVTDIIYFVTFCTANRHKILNNEQAFQIVRQELAGAEKRHGWRVGRFVVMPDHVHLFCSPAAEGCRDLSTFVGQIKQWSSRRLMSVMGLKSPVWQANFFDHLLRSSDSYQEKADYMWNNPVRAGLVGSADDWPYKDDLVPL